MTPALILSLLTATAAMTARAPEAVIAEVEPARSEAPNAGSSGPVAIDSRIESVDLFKNGLSRRPSPPAGSSGRTDAEFPLFPEVLKLSSGSDFFPANAQNLGKKIKFGPGNKLTCYCKKTLLRGTFQIQCHL